MTEQAIAGGNGGDLLPAVGSRHERRDLIDIKHLLRCGVFTESQVDEMLNAIHARLLVAAKKDNTRGVMRMYDCILETIKVQIAASKPEPRPAAGVLNVGIVFNTAEQSRLSAISAGLGITFLPESCTEPESGEGIEASNGSVPPSGEHGTGNGRVHDADTDPPAV